MMKNLLFLILLLATGLLFSQEEHEHEIEHEIHPHKDNIEIFFGNTYNIANETNLFTIGLDYENRLKKFNYCLGISLLIDYEFGHYGVLEEQEVPREFLITPTINVYPTEFFKLYGGGGLLITEGEVNPVLRLGTGYEFEIHHKVLIIPTASIDLAKDYQAIVAGISIGIGFH